MTKKEIFKLKMILIGFAFGSMTSLATVGFGKLDIITNALTILVLVSIGFIFGAYLFVEPIRDDS